MDAIFSRTSVRSYEEKPVESSKIEKILRAAMAAPSAMNQQPWEFYVVTDKSVLQELSQASPYTSMVAGAPVAIVVCGRKENMPVPDLVQVDLSLSTENVLLEIEEQGLGGVMLGIAPFADRMERVARALALPDTLEVFTVVPFGYPAKKNPQQDRYDESRVHYVK
ncbi:nitroreductase family protein [Anaerovibrio lipolyticus]|uniref:nitroreductase family protein n=1 Tax=Anaerovibrio lipolyticus TaxID=82374 RepID=UPI0004887978|nr:nitroreductase family protein [Anaerovibrio lipolyticus]